jgi:outer membrane protein OmpA-like peptidoglycan-associated protein
MGTTRLGITQKHPLSAAVFVLASLLSSTIAMATERTNLPHIPPVGDQALAFQGGYILPNEKLAGTVIGAREVKSYFSTGDTLYIRFVRNLDVRSGDWVTAYRLTKPVFHPVTKAYLGRVVRMLGILEVTSEPKDRVAEARLIQPLDSLEPGDPVMLYVPPAQVPDHGVSGEPVTGTIVEFKVPGQLTAQGEIVYIDLGAQDGIEAGDRLKVVRAGARESLRTFLPDYALAELKVLSVRDRTATTKVVKSLNALRRGDFVTRVPSRTASLGEERVEDPLSMLPKADPRENQDLSEEDVPKTPETGKTELKPIYFPYDRWSFSEADLIEAAEFLRAHPAAKLRIEGYADERGTREYNFILGEKRARAIHQYFEAQGFQNSMSVTSYGKERPVCNESGESCHSRNRRAQFVVDVD